MTVTEIAQHFEPEIDSFAVVIVLVAVAVVDFLNSLPHFPILSSSFSPKSPPSPLRPQNFHHPCLP
jgi:hypothetical protein